MKYLLTLLAVALIITGCEKRPDPIPRMVYVGAAIETVDQIELTRAVVDEIAGQLTERDFLTLDVIALDDLLPQYSSHVSRTQIRDTIAELALTASDEKTLIKAASNIATLCRENKDLPVRAFLITEGTKNEEIIHSIKDIAGQMQECTNLKLYLVGLSKEASRDTSDAFKPLRGGLSSARGNREWEPFVESL